MMQRSSPLPLLVPGALGPALQHCGLSEAAARAPAKGGDDSSAFSLGPLLQATSLGKLPLELRDTAARQLVVFVHRVLHMCELGPGNGRFCLAHLELLAQVGLGCN